MIEQYATTPWVNLIPIKRESRSKFSRRNLTLHCQETKNFLSTDPWITFLWIWSRCTSTFTINVLNIYGGNRCTPRVVKLIFHRLKGMSGITNDGCRRKLRYLKNANPCLKGHLQHCCKDIHCLFSLDFLISLTSTLRLCRSMRNIQTRLSGHKDNFYFLLVIKKWSK